MGMNDEKAQALMLKVGKAARREKELEDALDGLSKTTSLIRAQYYEAAQIRTEAQRELIEYAETLEEAQAPDGAPEKAR